MTLDHLVITILTGVVAALGLLAWMLLGRLEAERKACQHKCPLVETTRAQLRSLCYAWGELDRHAQEKREADLPHLDVPNPQTFVGGRHGGKKDALNREL